MGWVGFLFFASTETDSTTCVCPDSVESWLVLGIACMNLDLDLNSLHRGYRYQLCTSSVHTVWVHTSYLFLHEPEYLN